ncbi:MAG: hypothetical protein JOY62_01930 [Acidobacteriaceae bacterium]|nr:hypothetical protein [Acidobacteriaceae bacterium]MBV9778707.1 hypothetical protein [Acidobacteriaceae bacterium]
MTDLDFTGEQAITIVVAERIASPALLDFHVAITFCNAHTPMFLGPPPVLQNLPVVRLGPPGIHLAASYTGDRVKNLDD